MSSNGSAGKTMAAFFAQAAHDSASLEVHLDHPNPGFQVQSGICYAAHEDFVVMGPEGAPARVCVPYHAIRWFRRLDDAV